MKSIPTLLQSGSDLIEIFIKHPIHFFPILKKNKIIGYLSKKKVLRLSTNQSFLEKKILQVLPSLLENLSHDLFFNEIKEKEIKPVPYLLWVSDRVELHKKNPVEFFRKYKPVERLNSEDILTMIENHSLPMVAFDGSGKLLMENSAAKKIRALTKQIHSANPYLAWVKKTDFQPNSKIQNRFTGTKTYLGYKSVYHLQPYLFSKGSVNLVVFLSFQKKNR